MGVGRNPRYVGLLLPCFLSILPVTKPDLVSPLALGFHHLGKTNFRLSLSQCLPFF
jgi:hypothetical protein